MDQVMTLLPFLKNFLDIDTNWKGAYRHWKSVIVHPIGRRFSTQYSRTTADEVPRIGVGLREMINLRTLIPPNRTTRDNVPESQRDLRQELPLGFHSSLFQAARN